jgi:hypothetical protein
MKRIFACIASVMCVVTGSGAEKRGAADLPPLPFGAVVKGRVFAVKANATVLVGSLSLTGGPPEEGDSFPLAVPDEFPPRWKIGFGALVMTYEEFMPRGMRTREFDTIGLPVDITDPEEFRLNMHATGFSVNDPWHDTSRGYSLIWVLYEAMRDFVNGDDLADELPPFSNYEFYFDLVLEKPGACRYFVLASENLQTEIEETRKASVGKPPLEGTEGHPAAMLRGPGWTKRKDPLKPIMLGVWLKDARGQWALVDRFQDPPFKERFHAFVKGTTYFFLTDSGKVYVSKKPDKGERKLESLWDNPKYPIVAALEDADTGKVFLFGKAHKGDMPGKDFYWELDETVRRVDYDPSAVKPIKTVQPLKTVMEYARFLADEKKIKLEKK